MVDHYELLAIFPGTMSDEEAQTATAKLQDTLKEHGAAVTLHDFWGKRKLAYEINHIRHGFYDLTEFDVDRSVVNKLDSVLRLNDLVLRHQIVRKELKTPEELAAEAALHERIAAKRQALREKEQAATVAAETPTQATMAPVEPAGPVEQKKLDEKLEQILESDKVDI